MTSIRSLLRSSLRSPFLPLVVGVLTWTLPACDDDPFAVTWVANQDTTRLYSLDRPEVGLVSAFDFIGRRTVVVEAPGTTGTWDLAVDDVDGGLAFITPSGLGIESEAGIAAVPDLTLDELREAPGDSAAYAILDPVPAEVGTVYVIRTREARGQFSQLCLFFGKFEVTEVDPSSGSVSFVFDLNPDCDDRSLVPDQQPES